MTVERHRVAEIVYDSRLAHRSAQPSKPNRAKQQQIEFQAFFSLPLEQPAYHTTFTARAETPQFTPIHEYAVDGVEMTVSK